MVVNVCKDAQVTVINIKSFPEFKASWTLLENATYPSWQGLEALLAKDDLGCLWVLNQSAIHRWYKLQVCCAKGVPASVVKFDDLLKEEVV